MVDLLCTVGYPGQKSHKLSPLLCPRKKERQMKSITSISHSGVAYDTKFKT